jgi:hypothetical protein
LEVDYGNGFDEPIAFPRDPAIDAATARLGIWFDTQPNSLFYSTEIETSLEREFFHWITGKGLLELGDAGRIQRTTSTIRGNTVNFYAHGKHRYWRRQLASKVNVLARIYDPDFAHAVGRHGELMFDAALGRAGFKAEARNVQSWNGTTWTLSDHNLDRIYTRDGIAYGAEIKNTQNYISREELRVKLQMCTELGLVPLFIMRFAPKSYIHQIYRNHGFTLLFEQQMYPWGHNALLREVRSELGLKVHAPNDVPDGDIQRLLNWHSRRITK